MQKGSRVKIVDGKSGVGQTGEIFWWGESKYGDGMRAGVKADNDETFWVDAGDLEVTDEKGTTEATGEPAPPKAKKPPVEEGAFSRGMRVRIVDGKEAGKEGEIFWWGESKYGNGMRAGIETDAGDKVWAAGSELEASDGATTSTAAASPVSTEAAESFAPSSEMPDDSEIPLPDEPPPEFSDDYVPIDELMDMQDD